MTPFAWVRLTALAAGLAALGHTLPLNPHPEGQRGFRLTSLKVSEQHGDARKSGLFVSSRVSHKDDPEWDTCKAAEAKRAADRDRHCNTNTLGAVYDALCRHCNEYGYTWIGQRKLARRAKCTIRTLKRALRRLEQIGLIVRILRSAPGQWNDELGEHRSTIYLVRHVPLEPEVRAALPTALQKVRELAEADFLASGVLAEVPDAEDPPPAAPPASPASSARPAAPPAPSARPAAPLASPASSARPAAPPAPSARPAAPPASPASSARPAAPLASPEEYVRRALAELDAVSGGAWSEAAAHWLSVGTTAEKNAAQIAASIGDVVRKTEGARTIGKELAPDEILSMLDSFIPKEKRELKDPFAKAKPAPPAALAARELDRHTEAFREGRLGPVELAELERTLHPRDRAALEARGVRFSTGPPTNPPA